MEKDGKTCFNAEKMVLASEQCVKHPFAGQNTQQLPFCDHSKRLTNCRLSFVALTMQDRQLKQ